MALTDLTLPITLAEELGVGVGDTRLKRVIAAASAAIRQYCDRDFHYQAGKVELATPRLLSPRLVLSLTPVLAVTSVTLEGGQVVDPSEVVIENGDAGIIRRDAGWPWSGLARGGIMPNEPLAGSERPSITVTYTGGWVTPAQADSQGWSALLPRTLPEDLEQACIELAVALYRRGPNDPAVQSESLGSYSVTYRAQGPTDFLPPTVKGLLGSYKRAIR